MPSIFETLLKKKAAVIAQPAFQNSAKNNNKKTLSDLLV